MGKPLKEIRKCTMVKQLEPNSYWVEIYWIRFMHGEISRYYNYTPLTKLKYFLFSIMNMCHSFIVRTINWFFDKKAYLAYQFLINQPTPMMTHSKIIRCLEFDSLEFGLEINFVVIAKFYFEGELKSKLIYATEPNSIFISESISKVKWPFLLKKFEQRNFGNDSKRPFITILQLEFQGKKIYF